MSNSQKFWCNFILGLLFVCSGFLIAGYYEVNPPEEGDLGWLLPAPTLVAGVILMIYGGDIGSDSN